MKEKIDWMQAVERITELIMNLSAEENIDEETTLSTYLEQRRSVLIFYVEKLVKEILWYCNRRDFPDPLIYTVAELIFKMFRAQINVQGYRDSEDGDLSKVKMGDTEFGFDVGTKKALAELDIAAVFNDLRADLNRYRRIKAY